MGVYLVLDGHGGSRASQYMSEVRITTKDGDKGRLKKEGNGASSDSYLYVIGPTLLIRHSTAFDSRRPRTLGPVSILQRLVLLDAVCGGGGEGENGLE